VNDTPAQTVISWWAETGMMEARDIVMSIGENKASEEEELLRNY
jgi:hypothetical protein